MGFSIFRFGSGAKPLVSDAANSRVSVDGGAGAVSRRGERRASLMCGAHGMYFLGGSCGTGIALVRVGGFHEKAFD